MGVWLRCWLDCVVDDDERPPDASQREEAYW